VSVSLQAAARSVTKSASTLRCTRRWRWWEPAGMRQSAAVISAAPVASAVRCSGCYPHHHHHRHQQQHQPCSGQGQPRLCKPPDLHHHRV
jgi:hypothetical protein